MPNPASWKSWVAVGICCLSALLLSYVVLFWHYSAVTAFLWLWAIWHTTADWLGGRLRLLLLKPGEIRQRAYSIRLRGLSLGICRGSTIWLMAAGGYWLATL